MRTRITTTTATWHDFSYTADGHTPKINTELPTEHYRLVMIAQSAARRAASTTRTTA